MLVASHSTRFSTRASVCRSTSVSTATWERLFLEHVVDALVARAQLERLGLHVTAVDEHGGDQVGDLLHLLRAHAEARDLGGADPQPRGAVPIGRLVAGE